MNHTRRSNSVPQSMQGTLLGRAGPPIRGAVTPPNCCTCSASKTLCSVHQSWLQLQETLIEKEHSLSTLSDKISCLAIHETESKRKDSVIAGLREDIAELQKEIQEKKTRVSTLEDVLTTNEHVLIKKESQILMLSENVENIEKKLLLANRTTSGLQSQLSEKTDMIASKSDELKELKKGKRFVEDGLNSSKDEMKEKRATLASLNERVRRLKSVNEEMKTKFDMKEQECSRLIETERSLRQEVAKLKQKSNTVSEQLNNTRKHLSQTTSSNDDLATKVGHLQEQLDSLCHQLKSLIGLHTSTTPSSLTDANHIVSSVSLLVTEQLKMKQESNQYKMEINEIMERYSVLEMDAESVKDCLATLQLPFANFIPMETMISGTYSMLDKLQLKTDCISTMNSVLVTLVLQLKNMYSILHSVSMCVQQDYSEEGTDDTTLDVTKAVVQVCKEAQEYKAKCSQLEERLTITGDQQSSIKKQALASVKSDYEKKMIDAVEEMRRKEKDNYNQIMAAEKKRLETEKAKYTEKIKAKLDETQEVTQQIQNLLQEKENEMKAMSVEMDALKETCDKQTNELEQWRTRAEEMMKNHQETQLVTEVSSKMKEKDLHQTILEYKVQSQEHARTIVALERKLLSSLQNSSNSTTANDGLQAKVTSLENQLEESLQQLKDKSDSCDGIIDTLRRQLSLANEQVGKQKIEMTEIEESLRETEDIYKNKIAELQRQHTKELINLKHSLSNNEVMITELNQQLAITKGELKGKDELTMQIKQDNVILLEKLSSLQTSDKSSARGKKEDSMDTSPFSSVGKRCLGEQHDKVISNQEHGIIELRKRVNELMKNNPQVPSHQAALKELVQLRQEVSQMRAEEVIRQEKSKHQRINREEGRNIKEKMNDVVSIHKLKDVEEALGQSEEAYSSLLESVCSKLLCPIPQSMGATQKKFSEVNKIARQHIMRDREEFVKGPLIKAINGLRRPQPSLSVREEEVDRDMTEEVIQSPSVDTSTPDLTDCGVYPSKEIEELDKQKRLYQAITKRQEFKQTQQDRISQKSSHSCLVTPEDANHMMESVRKTYSDKLQRKDIEISKLKKDLHRSQQMTDAMASKIKISSH